MTPFKIGDVLYVVSGTYKDEFSTEAELYWETWTAVKITACGAWFSGCHDTVRRWANADTCAWGQRTKDGALAALVARKTSHIRFLERDLEFAQNVRALAREALA